ncbi:MAG: P-loop NTPase [Thermodesulfobacteria bacterium]|nr:P-loop NTPase [Thermodesulfobacteriota bacterium]
MKIAVCGKGGVGKSTVSAFLIKALLDRGRKVLAIDADPSPHLARLLGFDDSSIKPIAQMKDLLNERSGRDGPFYNLNPKVDDLPEKFMKKKGNLSLMVLGAIQQGGAGCACADNAVLRNLLNRLLLSENEDIVLDMEAGVEHLGRGTIASVDHILIVVQPYRGSVETADKIDRLARDLKIRSLHVVANNCQDEEDVKFIEEMCGCKPIGVFFTSQDARKAERQGRPITEAAPEMVEAADKIISALEKA